MWAPSLAFHVRCATKNPFFKKKWGIGLLRFAAIVIGFESHYSAAIFWSRAASQTLGDIPPSLQNGCRRPGSHPQSWPFCERKWVFLGPLGPTRRRPSRWPTGTWGRLCNPTRRPASKSAAEEGLSRQRPQLPRAQIGPELAWAVRAYGAKICFLGHSPRGMQPSYEALRDRGRDGGVGRA